ncbi:MAG: hypothetical protein U9N81_05665 [Bacillota bacterium]|nr:hypothetical protein [Bacillota bacterium]
MKSTEQNGSENKGKWNFWVSGFSKEFSWRTAFYLTLFLFGSFGFLLQYLIYTISPPNSGTWMAKLVSAVQLLGWEQGLLLSAIFEGAYKRKLTLNVMFFLLLYAVIFGFTLYKVIG